jgi:GT2 family glycosyltransferase
MDALHNAAEKGGRHSLLVVILNFNGIADTLECLASLRAQTLHDVDILVVDNASQHSQAAQIAAAFPEVEVIALPVNEGWAGGNNVGLRLALERGHGHVCLLNNDTLLDNDALEALLDASDRLEGRAMVMPAVRFYDRPDNWQLRPDPASPGPSPDLVALNFAFGVCLLLPAGLLREIGLLDERFFLQLEETDYHLRAAAAGYGSFCALHARITHKESASFGGRVTEGKTYYEVRNTLLLARKHAATPRGFLRAGRNLLWSLHRKAAMSDPRVGGWLGFLRWLASQQPLARAARQGLGDFLRGRFGARGI